MCVVALYIYTYIYGLRKAQQIHLKSHFRQPRDYSASAFSHSTSRIEIRYVVKAEKKWAKTKMARHKWGCHYSEI